MFADQAADSLTELSMTEQTMAELKRQVKGAVERHSKGTSMPADHLQSNVISEA